MLSIRYLIYIFIITLSHPAPADTSQSDLQYLRLRSELKVDVDNLVATLLKSSDNPQAVLSFPEYLDSQYNKKTCIRIVNISLLLSGVLLEDIVDENHETILHLAVAQYVPQDVVAIIVEAGGPTLISAANSENQTPMDFLSAFANSFAEIPMREVLSRHSEGHPPAYQMPPSKRRSAAITNAPIIITKNMHRDDDDHYPLANLFCNLFWPYIPSVGSLTR